jgi:hypothetical protein
VTSRDQYIAPSFRKVCLCISLETGDPTSQESSVLISNDTSSNGLLKSHLRTLRYSHGPGRPQLTDCAVGLFLWADTVMRYSGQDFPKSQLERIQGGAFREEGDNIDQLYQQILQLSLKGPEVIKSYNRVFGAIVHAKRPLHRLDLAYFLESQEDGSRIDFVLGKLSSVISIQNAGRRIHTSHLSFLRVRLRARAM